MIQDTYAALAAMARVDHIDAPRAYMFRTAHRVVLRHQRRARLVRFEPLDFAYAADGPSPEQQISDQNELLDVLRIIARLPERCREAFALRRLEGLSQREVARRMGIAESTVEKHMGRALKLVADAAVQVGADPRQGELDPDRDAGG